MAVSMKNTAFYRVTLCSLTVFTKILGSYLALESPDTWYSLRHNYIQRSSTSKPSLTLPNILS